MSACSNRAQHLPPIHSSPFIGEESSPAPVWQTISLSWHGSLYPFLVQPPLSFNENRSTSDLWKHCVVTTAYQHKTQIWKADKSPLLNIFRQIYFPHLRKHCHSLLTCTPPTPRPTFMFFLSSSCTLASLSKNPSLPSNCWLLISQDHTCVSPSWGVFRLPRVMSSLAHAPFSTTLSIATISEN